MNKVMDKDGLEEIITRLHGCLAVFQVIQRMSDSEFTDALSGACDLLESIYRDFQTDVESAESVD